MIAALSDINGIVNAAWVNVIALDSIVIVHCAVLLVVFARKQTKQSADGQAADHSADPAHDVKGAAYTCDEAGFESADQVFAKGNAGWGYSIHQRSTQYDAASPSVRPNTYF